MYEIAASFAVTLICIIVIPNIVVELDKLCSRLDELTKCRKRRRELLNEYNKWYDKAISCDSFGGAIYKGKAIAMLVVINHELNVIKGDVNSRCQGVIKAEYTPTDRHMQT